MKKFFFLTALCLAALFALCACDAKAPDTPTGEITGAETMGLSETEDGLFLILPTGDGTVKVPVERKPITEFGAYSVMRGEECTEDEVAAAKLVYKAFSPYSCGIEITTDWINRGEEVPADGCEILVGQTNRPVYAEEKLRINDFCILSVGSRIAVYGGSDAATVRAAETFRDYFIDAETESVLVPLDGGYAYRDAYPCTSLSVNGVPLWEYGIVNEEEDTAPAASGISSFCLRATGYPSAADDAEHKILLKKGNCDGLCSVSAENGDITILVNADDALLGSRYFLTLLCQKGGISLEKSGQTADAALTAEIFREEDVGDPVYLYVSPDGNDGADGTQSAPLATLRAAKEKVHTLLYEDICPVTVYLRGGDYYLTEGVFFDEGDSGLGIAPVTYCAYKNETVNLIGGIRIDPSLIKKAENNTVTSRVLDASAKEKLMQLDLSGIFDSLPGYYSFGHTEDGETMPVTVYLGSSALDSARYPNNIPGKAYLKTTEMIDNGSGVKALKYDDETAKRVALWSQDAAKDLYVFGFLAWDWINESYDIGANGLDRTNNTFTVPGSVRGYYDSITSGTRYYFYNLPEEIDVPGESYTDRDARIVYFLPTDDFSAENVYVSTLTDPIMTFDNTKHIVLDGIRFLYTRNNAVTADGTDDFTLRNCEILYTSSNAATLRGSHITVTGCHAAETYAGGFRIEGGDIPTLTPSYSVLENCDIHSVNRSQETYAPAVHAGGLGMTVRNNRIHDGVHEMINVGSNDVVIEYNEIYNCVTEASDMGAIYFGRDPSLMGVVIRYNYFHDIGNDYGGIGQQAIFVDDGGTGAEIIGNIFLRAANGVGAIKAHGSQYFSIRNNLFIDTYAAFENADWGGENTDRQLRYMRWLYGRDNSDRMVLNRLESVGFDSEIWHARYDGTNWERIYDYINSQKIEEYAAMDDETFEKTILVTAPENSNRLWGNVLVNCFTKTGGSASVAWNYLAKDTDIFRSYETGDFTLTEEALTAVREKYPQFEEIPIEKIGLHAAD